MRCLDSDLLVAILRGNKDAADYMGKIDQEGTASTTAISAYEILFGARLSKAPENIEESAKLLGKLKILLFDEKAAEKASEIHFKLKESGQEINIKDIFIASTAITNGHAIVTRNAKDFSRIKEAEIEKW